ncbi:hypothetical protein [Haloferula sp. A504]|uniref:hypothetical protein n=1 Tax=Haloferula sp. A504 TaxID=3373601 RepID=UPI0031C85E1F|nr:hypothetical protein [Verrucomicrobiaceae bacterium E54]
MSAASIKFSCPSCGQHLSATQELFGQSIQCPACSEAVVVPSIEEEPDGPEPTQALPTTPSEQPSAKDRRSLLPHLLGILVGIFLLGFFLDFIGGPTEDRGDLTESDEASSNPPSEAGRAFAARDEDQKVKLITEQIIRNSLKAPSTANFSNFQVVAEEGPFRQTYIEVDAQNGFGAMIRSYYVCTFKLLGGDRFSTSPLSSHCEVSQLHGRPIASLSELDHKQMDLHKGLIDWPGFEHLK